MRTALSSLLSIVLATSACGAVTSEISARDLKHDLKGFDAYMAGVLRSWNVPGIGIGVVIKDHLAFSRGYGFRDNARKLPFTEHTLFPIGSNTKLFTAIAAGLLVEEGRLSYDRPIREAVPTIAFYDDNLNNWVTLRDMLSHRTGVTRHDSIWYKSDFTSDDLFQKLRYLEPAQPPRESFLYNNMMYAAVGHIIEMKAGNSYWDYIKGRILGPLDMHSTVFSVKEMLAGSDHALPYSERRNGGNLYQIPYYDEFVGLQPAGAIISNIEDLSHWLAALMGNGIFHGRQVIPPRVLAATLEPAIALPNSNGDTWTSWDLLNTTYGMARFSSVYRGHLITYHGGHIDGYRAQISYLPHEQIGVIVLVMGEHAPSLYDAITYAMYDRLLGLTPTLATNRLLAAHIKQRMADANARQSAAAAKPIIVTPHSHPLSDYVGDYENPAYGLIQIAMLGDQLQYNLHHVHKPLTHYNYERFDTDDDELDGKQSINFGTNPQGEVDRFMVSLDEAQAEFVRRPPTLSSKVLERLAGFYEDSSGNSFEVQLRAPNKLQIIEVGLPPMILAPYRSNVFQAQDFADTTFEFVESEGIVTSLKKANPTGVYSYRRR